MPCRLEPKTIIETAHKPFKVSFFTNYEGDRQYSMLRYADELQASLRQFCGSLCEIHRYAPRYDGKSTSETLSRWKKYFENPYLALRHKGPVNHIADHGNSHLVNFLPHDRTIVTCHDLIPLRLADRLKGISKRGRYSFWCKVVHMRSAACIMADSESTRRDVITLLGIPSKRVHVVYLGLKLEDFSPLKKSESKEQLKQQFKFSWPLTLLHVGAAAFYKNLEGVIDTLGSLRDKHHLDIHLVRMGSPLPETLRELISRRRLDSFVHDIQVKSDVELRGLYLASDVLLFPSWWEGFGWPPLEALACGVPVIASPRGSLPEITGSAALQVDPEDLDGMAGAVRRVLEDQTLRGQLREAGFGQASKFQWQKTAEQTAQLYRTVSQEAGGDL